VARPEVRPAEPVSAPVTEVTPAPVPALNSLDPELTVLPARKTACRTTCPALRRLSEYDRRFGKGALEQERQALAASPCARFTPAPWPRPRPRISTRCPRIAAGRARAFGVQAISDEISRKSNGIAPGRER